MKKLKRRKRKNMTYICMSHFDEVDDEILLLRQQRLLLL